MTAERQFEVLQRASLFLEKHNREARVAELLLQHHLGFNRNQFFMNMREPVEKEIINRFMKDVEQHAKTGVPIQHLTGCESFYGREFWVNQHVLIPRPETEELIMRTIELAKKYPNPVIVDVGTGSGIIAATLALEIPGAAVYATDISGKALDVAKQNAKNLGANVTFLQGDFLQPLIDKALTVDILVSNPPYIDRKDTEQMTDTVKNFDPELALFAEENGLAAYRKIIAQAPEVLQRSAHLAFEIGHEQKTAVEKLIETLFPEAWKTTYKDINGKDRITIAERKADE